MNKMFRNIFNFFFEFFSTNKQSINTQFSYFSRVSFFKENLLNEFFKGFFFNNFIIMFFKSEYNLWVVFFQFIKYFLNQLILFIIYPAFYWLSEFLLWVYYKIYFLFNGSLGDDLPVYKQFLFGEDFLRRDSFNFSLTVNFFNFGRYFRPLLNFYKILARINVLRRLESTESSKRVSRFLEFLLNRKVLTEIQYNVLGFYNKFLWKKKLFYNFFVESFYWFSISKIDIFFIFGFFYNIYKRYLNVKWLEQLYILISFFHVYDFYQKFLSYYYFIIMFSCKEFLFNIWLKLNLIDSEKIIEYRKRFPFFIQSNFIYFRAVIYRFFVKLIHFIFYVFFIILILIPRFILYILFFFLNLIFFYRIKLHPLWFCHYIKDFSNGVLHNGPEFRLLCKSYSSEMGFFSYLKFYISDFVKYFKEDVLDLDPSRIPITRPDNDPSAIEQRIMTFRMDAEHTAGTLELGEKENPNNFVTVEGVGYDSPEVIVNYKKFFSYVSFFKRLFSYIYIFCFFFVSVYIVVTFFSVYLILILPLGLSISFIRAEFIIFYKHTRLSYFISFDDLVNIKTSKRFIKLNNQLKNLIFSYVFFFKFKEGSVFIKFLKWSFSFDIYLELIQLFYNIRAFISNYRLKVSFNLFIKNIQIGFFFDSFILYFKPILIFCYMVYLCCLKLISYFILFYLNVTSFFFNILNILYSIVYNIIFYILNKVQFNLINRCLVSSHKIGLTKIIPAIIKILEYLSYLFLFLISGFVILIHFLSSFIIKQRRYLMFLKQRREGFYNIMLIIYTVIYNNDVFKYFFSHKKYKASFYSRFLRLRDDIPFYRNHVKNVINADVKQVGKSYNLYYNTDKLHSTRWDLKGLRKKIHSYKFFKRRQDFNITPPVYGLFFLKNGSKINDLFYKQYIFKRYQMRVVQGTLHGLKMTYIYEWVNNYYNNLLAKKWVVNYESFFSKRLLRNNGVKSNMLKSYILLYNRKLVELCFDYSILNYIYISVLYFCLFVYNFIGVPFFIFLLFLLVSIFVFYVLYKLYLKVLPKIYKIYKIAFLSHVFKPYTSTATGLIYTYIKLVFVFIFNFKLFNGIRFFLSMLGSFKNDLIQFRLYKERFVFFKFFDIVLLLVYIIIIFKSCNLVYSTLLDFEFYFLSKNQCKTMHYSYSTYDVLYDRTKDIDYNISDFTEDSLFFNEVRLNSDLIRFDLSKSNIIIFLFSFFCTCIGFYILYYLLLIISFSIKVFNKPLGWFFLVLSPSFPFYNFKEGRFQLLLLYTPLTTSKKLIFNYSLLEKLINYFVTKNRFISCSKAENVKSNLNIDCKLLVKEYKFLYEKKRLNQMDLNIKEDLNKVKKDF